MRTMANRQRVDYGKYMASREWALKKQEVKARANDICERCFDADIQNIHHLTYERLGNEDIETDLRGVCRPCHEYLSAVRDVDPAMEVVYSLILAFGLLPRVVTEEDGSRRMEWVTGPTSKGRYFKGTLKTQAPDSADAPILACIDGRAGIWFHCASERD